MRIGSCATLRLIHTILGISLKIIADLKTRGLELRELIFILIIELRRIAIHATCARKLDSSGTIRMNCVLRQRMLSLGLNHRLTRNIKIVWTRRQMDEIDIGVHVGRLLIV